MRQTYPSKIKGEEKAQEKKTKKKKQQKKNKNKTKTKTKQKKRFFLCYQIIFHESFFKDFSVFGI